MFAVSSISTVRPSPALATKCQTAGGPGSNEARFRKSSGVMKPSAFTQTRALGENVAVHRHARIQIRAEHAIVFGIDRAEIHAQPRHAADAVGQQNQRLFSGMAAHRLRF